MAKNNPQLTVCIVGRPNVGKSSLFNALTGERKAIVFGESGTTRDRVETVILVGGQDVKIVDTGGYLTEDKDVLSKEIKRQIQLAMEEASIMLMVADAAVGVTPADKEIAALLRKFNKPVFIAANKANNDKLFGDALEFYQLGFGEVAAISCLHRRGIGELKKTIEDTVKSVALAAGAGEKIGGEEKKYLKLAIVGRPNVGKSSFINRLLKANRVIVSDKPGTTRDSIDTYFSLEDEDYILIDTAGIRHERKIKTVVDTFSIMRSKESITRSDVAILILDAADGVTRDDLGILNFIEESGKGCVVLVNKWDLARQTEGITVDYYKKELLWAAHELSKFPVSFISALSGENIPSCLDLARTVNFNLDLKAATSQLNKIFEKNNPTFVPVGRNKKRPNFLYIVQSGTRPVEFSYFVNDPAAVLGAHLSFIENKLRENLPLLGIPFTIKIRGSRKTKKDYSPDS